jgi:hypothetical protein
VTLEIDGFLAELDRIPWFANLGKPSPLDGTALRITSWEGWPGPENPGSNLMSEAAMSRRNRIHASGDVAAIEAAWNQIHQRVFQLTKGRVPWNDDEDAWYGPNAAVMEACWTAALVGVARALKLDLDAGGIGDDWTLAIKWRWFEAGHWPCLYFWQWGYCDLAQAARHGEFHQLVVL